MARCNTNNHANGVRIFWFAAVCETPSTFLTSSGHGAGVARVGACSQSAKALGRDWIWPRSGNSLSSEVSSARSPTFQSSFMTSTDGQITRSKAAERTTSLLTLCWESAQDLTRLLPRPKALLPPTSIPRNPLDGGHSLSDSLCGVSDVTADWLIDGGGDSSPKKLQLDKVAGRAPRPSYEGRGVKSSTRVSMLLYPRYRGRFSSWCQKTMWQQPLARCWSVQHMAAVSGGTNTFGRSLLTCVLSQTHSMADCAVHPPRKAISPS